MSGWSNSSGATGLGAISVQPVLGESQAPALVIVVQQQRHRKSPMRGSGCRVIAMRAKIPPAARVVTGDAKILATRPMVFMGRISYGLYLLHLPVFFMVEKVIPSSPLVVRLGAFIFTPPFYGKDFLFTSPRAPA